MSVIIFKDLPLQQADGNRSFNSVATDLTTILYIEVV